MDARAVLTAQGWRGDGHALREGGLKRQILAAHKLDLKGLGHARPGSSNGPGAGSNGIGAGGAAGSGGQAASGWWDDVFSSKLKNITVAAAKAAEGATSALSEVVAAARAQADAAAAIVSTQNDSSARDATTQTGMFEASRGAEPGAKAPARRNADVLARSLDRHFTHGGTLRGNDDAELARLRQANAAALNGGAMIRSSAAAADSAEPGSSKATTADDKKKAKRKRDNDGDADAAAALAAIIDTPPTSSASAGASDAGKKSKRAKKSRDGESSEQSITHQASKKAKSRSGDTTPTAVQPGDAAPASHAATEKPVRKHKLKIKADKAQRAEKLLAAAFAATSTRADGAAGDTPSNAGPNADSRSSLKERELEASLARLSDDKLGAAVGKMRKEDSRIRKAARAEKKRRKAQRNAARELKKQRQRAEGKRARTKSAS